jgi:hypothetical protein
VWAVFDRSTPGPITETKNGPYRVKSGPKSFDKGGSCLGLACTAASAEFGGRKRVAESTDALSI